MVVRVLWLFLSLLLWISAPAFGQSPPLVPFPPSPLVKLAVNPVTNKVYVVNELDNTVTAYDEAAGTSTTIPVGPRPQFIAVNPATNRVYVNNAGDSTLTVIDGATDTNLTPTALALGSQGPIAVNAATNVIYVVRMSSAARDEVTFVDGNTNEWYTIATESYQPTAMAVNPVTNTIFVAHYATGDVRVISGAFDRNNDFPATTSIPSWTHPFAVAVNPVTNKAYVITEDSRGPIGIIDGATLTADFPLPATGHAQGPKAIAVNPVTNKVYAAFTDEVVVIDGATNAYAYVPVGTTGSGPVSIAVNARTNKVYVATSNGALVVIDGATNATTTLAIPANAVSLALNPLTNQAYTFGDTLSRTDIDAAGSPSTPISTTISTLPSDTSDPNPAFTFTASSGFSPTAPPIAGVYYQLDSTAGRWSAASGNGPFGASFTDLAPGGHTLYAFAADAQLPVTSTGSQSYPVLGAIASYAFTVTGTPRATPTVSLLSSKNPADPGASVTFTATVSGSAGTPTGTIAFRDAGATLAGCGAVALASGSASCTTSSLAAGSHAITAQYSGDTAYTSATSGAVTQTIKAPATVALASSANPATTGQSVTLSVTVTGAVGTATGSVSITDNGTPLAGCTSLALASGAASCAVSTLSTGSHALAASYGGDGTYAAATSPTLTQAVKVATTTALTSSANPSTSGAPLTLMVSVAGSGGTPTGTVTVNDGATAIAGCSGLVLANGSASCTVSTLSTGAHTLTAAYAGDATFNASTSPALSQTIGSGKVNASLALASSANPSVAGQSVTFTLTVSGTAGTPTGTASFSDNGSTIAGCGAVALAGGQAQCTAALPSGTHAVNASYGGDDAYNAGTSPTVSQVVNAPKVNPAVALSSSSNPAVTGQAVVLTVNVTGSAGTASGTVSITDNGSAIPGCASLTLASGAASCSTANLAIGSHPLVATYGGDSAYNAGASATLTQSITPVPAIDVSLATSANPSQAGAGVTFTATLSGNVGAPTGSVDFLDGAATIAGCASVAVAGGSASCATASLAAGAHDIVARYSGDATYGAASSPALRQVVESPPGAPALALSTRTVDFGGQSMGTTSLARAVTLTNVGNAPLAVSSVTLSGTQFDAASDCSTLAPGASCTLALAFTPAAADVPLNGSVAVQGSASIATNASSSPDTVALAGSAEKSLVTHYYQSILRREPDAGGKQFWMDESARLVALGANVNEAWYAMAMSFLASPEYLAQARDDAGYVTDLYNTFFNRAPDAGGLGYWTQQMASGTPRGVVLVAFMFSPEFQDFTRGIFGDTAARAEVDVVGDFYRGLLARLPDDAGMRNWVGAFRQAQCGNGDLYATVEAISSGFANSPEYANRNRSNAEYVGDLYNAFLRRGGDPDGVRYWIGQLDTGAMSRDAVRRQFIASSEFGQRVSAIAAQGCVQ